MRNKLETSRERNARRRGFHIVLQAVLFLLVLSWFFSFFNFFLILTMSHWKRQRKEFLRRNDLVAPQLENLNSFIPKGIISLIWRERTIFQNVVNVTPPRWSLFCVIWPHFSSRTLRIAILRCQFHRNSMQIFDKKNIEVRKQASTRCWLHSWMWKNTCTSFLSA